MYSVLIVDDERYAVQAVKSKMDWTGLGVGDVREALHVPQAKQVLAEHAVDVIICDIEMPGESGIDLLEWVREHAPATETIFLTCHSEFDYARRAIHLGSMDYLLKPVDYDALFASVARALERISAARRQELVQEKLSRYSNDWNRHKPILIERFWQDLINERIPQGQDAVSFYMHKYDIPLTPGGGVIPVLLSVEGWRQSFIARDEEILEYALRNAAHEIIVAGHEGFVVQDGDGVVLVLLYGASLPDSRELVDACKSFIAVCNEHFYCSLSCYLGEATIVAGLPVVCRSLRQQERENVLHTNAVLLPEDRRSAKTARLLPPAFEDLSALIEWGRIHELEARIAEYFEGFAAEEITLERLEAVYHGFLQMIYSSMVRKGIDVGEIYRNRELGLQGEHVRSVHHLKEWMRKVAVMGAEYLSTHDPHQSAAVSKVKAYIDAHLQEPISREELAAHVFLNPAYLSRLFKKETGVSLSEFISAAKLEKAKELLRQSPYKIHAVAEMVGYENVPHFTRAFKKAVGVSPQQYRMKYQGLEEGNGAR